jgi:hypothetical protein
MNDLREMFSTHPDPAGPNGDAAIRCIEAAQRCAGACTICADACLGETDVASMVACIRLNLDCAEVCRVTATLLTRPSHRDAPALRAQLQACVEMCRACAEECARHAEHGSDHCRLCAEACRACAEACDAMAAALVP